MEPNNLYTNRRLRVKRRVVKYVCRAVPQRSKIKVQLNQEVTPDEIIAQGEVLLGFRSLNLATLLQVSPKEVKKYLQRQVGQKIFKGELLAFKEISLLQPEKVIISPTDGILESFNDSTGELRMGFIPKPISTPAAVFGIVEGVDQPAGKVLIKTEVTEVFGILGSGKGREGILHFIGRRGNLTRAGQIGQENGGNVLVSGGLVYKEAISAAISFGVHGLVTGGINAKDYVGISGGQLKFPRGYNTDVGITVVVCEGFGSIPLGQDIFEEMGIFDGKFALIDGNQAKITLPSFDEGYMDRIRKTVLQKRDPTFDEGLNGIQVGELSLGQDVRIIAPPFMGEQGKVVAIDKSPTVLPSGIVTYQLTLEPLTRKIKVQHPNVEILDRWV